VGNINVAVKRTEGTRHPLPSYATEGSAAVDFYAHVGGSVRLFTGDRALISLGVSMAIPKGKVLLLTPRSGLALKKGVTLTNSPGVIDSDYRGTIGAIVQNLGDDLLVITDGDKICQGGFYDYERATFEEVDELDDTERGTNGFGSTGV